jgi:hypothetical protein
VGVTREDKAARCPDAFGRGDDLAFNRSTDIEEIHSDEDG